MAKSSKQKGGGGNSHQRAVQRAAKVTTQEPEKIPRIPPAPAPTTAPSLSRWYAFFKNKIIEKKNDAIALVGLIAAFGSWGYTVLNPQVQP